MADETPQPSRITLPALGSRGGGWVAGQAVLIAAVAVSALFGRGWSGAWLVVAIAIGATLFGLGLLLLGWAGVHLGSSLTPFPVPRASAEATATGPYAWVRHPMYGGAILVALGWSIVFATLPGAAATIVLAVFLDLKARREEAWLCERLEGYTAYRRRTRRRLIPFVY